MRTVRRYAYLGHIYGGVTHWLIVEEVDGVIERSVVGIGTDNAISIHREWLEG